MLLSVLPETPGLLSRTCAPGAGGCGSSVNAASARARSCSPTPPRQASSCRPVRLSSTSAASRGQEPTSDPLRQKCGWALTVGITTPTAGVAAPPNPILFTTVWSAAGAAMAATFYQPAFAALTRWYGPPAFAPRPLSLSLAAWPPPSRR